MLGYAPSRVIDLLTAAKAVSDDEAVWGCFPYTREGAQIANFHRYIEVLSFVSKGPCHTAASRPCSFDGEFWNKIEDLSQGA